MRSPGLYLEVDRSTSRYTPGEGYSRSTSSLLGHTTSRIFGWMCILTLIFVFELSQTNLNSELLCQLLTVDRSNVVLKWNILDKGMIILYFEMN